MSWRQSADENIRDLHNAFLCSGLLLGLDMTVRGVVYIHAVPSLRTWGIALITAVLISGVGQILRVRGHHRLRWLPSFVGHVMLCALYAGLAAESFLSFEPSHNGQLSFAILFSSMAMVHRSFIHWKSDVPE